jgi:hypothetical protein
VGGAGDDLSFSEHAQHSGSGTAPPPLIPPRRKRGEGDALRPAARAPPSCPPLQASIPLGRGAAPYFGADFTSASHLRRSRTRSAAEPYFAVS